MDAFRQYLIDRRDEALDAAGNARGHLIRLLDEGDHHLAPAMEQVTTLQAYAAWWTAVTDHIDHGGLDPVTALATTRTTAHQLILSPPRRSPRSMFDHAQSLAVLDAARRFYHDTARLDLDAITAAAK